MPQDSEHAFIMLHEEASPELTQRGLATYTTVPDRGSFVGDQRPL